MIDDIVLQKRKRKRRGICKPVFRGTPCKWGHIAMRDSHGYCRACKNESTKRSKNYKKRIAAYGAKNKDRIKKRLAEYRAKNREILREKAREVRHNNPEKERERYKKYYAKNKTKISMRTRLRQGVIKRATPPWFDAVEVQKLYEERNRLTKETGIIHHIDHIIPLRGKNVCGLHVHTNLQVLSRAENISKFNKYESD